MASTFPGSVDVFKTIPTPTTTPTSLSDASDDTLATRLQQHSDSIVAVESWLGGLVKTVSLIVAVNQSINCSGALSINAFLSANAGALTFTFTNVSTGAQFNIVAVNGGGAPTSINFQMQAVGGAFYTPWSIRSTGLSRTDSSGNFTVSSIASGQAVAFSIGTIVGNGVIGTLTI